MAPTWILYPSSEFFSSASSVDKVWTYSRSFIVICLSKSAISSRCSHFSDLNSFFNSAISLTCFWISSSTYLSSSLWLGYLQISCGGSYDNRTFYVNQIQRMTSMISMHCHYMFFPVYLQPIDRNKFNNFTYWEMLHAYQRFWKILS